MQKWISSFHSLRKDIRGIYTATICLYMMTFVILLVVFVSAGQIYAAHAKLQTAADASAMGGAVKLAELIGTNAIDKDGKPTDVAKKKVKVATNEVFRQNIGGEVGELNTDATEDKPSLHKYRVGGNGLTDKTKVAYVEVEAQRIIKLFRGTLPILPSVTITASARAIVPGEGVTGNVTVAQRVPIVVVAPPDTLPTKGENITLSMRSSDLGTTHTQDTKFWTGATGSLTETAYVYKGVPQFNDSYTSNVDSNGTSHYGDSRKIYGLLPVYYKVGAMQSDLGGKHINNEQSFVNHAASAGYQSTESFNSPKLFTQLGWKTWINWLYGRDVTKLGDGSEDDLEKLSETDEPYAVGMDMATATRDGNAKDDTQFYNLLNSDKSIIIRELLLKAMDDRLYRAEHGEVQKTADGKTKRPDVIYMLVVSPPSGITYADEMYKMARGGRPFSFKGMSLYNPKLSSMADSNRVGTAKFYSTSTVIAFQIQSWDVGNYQYDLSPWGQFAGGRYDGIFRNAVPKTDSQYYQFEGTVPAKGDTVGKDPLAFDQVIMGGYVMNSPFPAEYYNGDVWSTVYAPWSYASGHTMGFELHGKVIDVKSNYNSLETPPLDGSTNDGKSVAGDTGGASFVHLGDYGDTSVGTDNSNWL